MLDLDELQLNWKEREARWAAAQASQRTQLRQLCQENKQLAFQIKQLKVEQGKKVRFAPTRSAQPRIPQFPRQEKEAEVRRVTLPAPKKVSEAPTSHMRTRSASPSIRIPSPEESKAGDLDTLLSKYKNMYDSGQSPSSSLVLDSPRKISKAYNEMFSDKAGEQSSSTILSDEETLYKEPVFTQDKSMESVDSSRRTSSSFSASDKTDDSVIEVTKAETVKNSVPHVKFADQSSNYCPPKLSTHSDSEPYHSLIHEDGTRQLWFPSGNTLKISPDGLTRRVVFHNGDIQETLAREGIVRYFYAETRAWHETFSDGTQTITFPDGQKEMVTPSGRREVKFADQSLLQLLEDGSQTAESDTGVKLILDPDGTSTLILPNGVKEIRTSEHTRLEYPDGTVRTKYPSGMLETKYANGRVRMKDSTGKLIMDTHSPV
ncbi:hypothetical protein B566_EDAN016626 [Ephemera danica]|nr:hypothetical protein B566_EDAN016626 [Ephemera danica]